MSELTERARQVTKHKSLYVDKGHQRWLEETIAPLIEQALRAERRLALEFCAELPLEGKPDHPEENGTAAHLRTEIKRAAAEREVGTR